MKVILTPRELMDRGKWDKACEVLGYNPWCVNEGQMDSDKEIVMTIETMTEIGIVI